VCVVCVWCVCVRLCRNTTRRRVNSMCVWCVCVCGVCVVCVGVVGCVCVGVCSVCVCVCEGVVCVCDVWWVRVCVWGVCVGCVCGVCGCVSGVCVLLLFIIKHAPSPGNDTVYYNVTSYWYLVICRGCSFCLCSRCRTLHSLYNV